MDNCTIKTQADNMDETNGSDTITFSAHFLPRTQESAHMAFQNTTGFPSPIIYLDKTMLSCLNSVKYKSNLNLDCADCVGGNSPCDVYVEYEMFAERLENIFYSDSYGSDASGRGEFLSVTLESLKNGWIVNDTVYLESDSWNTIILGSTSDKSCTVCDRVLTSNWDEHITMPRHVENMKKFQPLKKYGLNIIREIRGSFHCSVCSSVFTDEEQHISSEDHQNKLIDSISKVDVLLLSTNSRDNEYDFVQDENTTNNNYISFNDDYIQTNDGCIQTNEGYIQTKDGYIQTKDGYIQTKDGYIQTNDDGIQANETPIKSISYASMARKPKLAVSEFINFTLGNTNVKVKFDSWHMVVNVHNKFHCMACNVMDHRVLKKAHCNDKDHLNVLKLCLVVLEFKGYLVRRVNDTFYHCAHCNNLQYKHDIINHLAIVHPKKAKLTTIDNMTTAENTSSASFNDKNIKNIQNNDRQINDAQKNDCQINDAQKNDCQMNDAQKNDGQINDAQKNDAHNNDPQINDAQNDRRDMPDRCTQNSMVDLNLFGYIFKVSLHAFHVLDKRICGFYCGLCDQLVRDPDEHIHGLKHIEVLQRTPFVEQFHWNLIRPIKQALHCTICNVSIPPNLIYQHCHDKCHNDRLAIAINATPLANHWPTPHNAFWPQHFHHNTFGPRMSVVRPAVLNPGQRPQVLLARPREAGLHHCTSTSHSYSRPTLHTQSNTVDTAASDVRSADTAKIAGNAKDALQCGNLTQNAISADNAKGAIQSVNLTQNEISAENAKDALQSGSLTQNVISAENAKSALHNNNLTQNTIAEHAKTTVQHTPSSLRNAATANMIASKIVENAKNAIRSNIGTSATSKNLENAKNATDTEQNTLDNAIKEGIEVCTSTSELERFNFEDYVYLKYQNTYFRVSTSAHNCLVPSGHGRFCFLCDVQLRNEEVSLHADSRQHNENVDKNHFVVKYDKHLLRQMYLTYHCGLCNVLVPKKFVQMHLEWASHLSQMDSSQSGKRLRRRDLANGKTEKVIKMQKECIYLNGTEPKRKILFNIKVVADANDMKKNKLIMFLNSAYKLSFECWHSLVGYDGYKCLLCGETVPTGVVNDHVTGDRHTNALDKFETDFLPAFIRQINSTSVNCATCNIEVPNRRKTIEKHIVGKKHIRNYDTMVDNTAKDLDNCEQDVLTLVK